MTEHDPTWPLGVLRVAEALQTCEPVAEPFMLESDARTAQEAADALGVALGQIAKSVVFRRLADDAPVLVMTAGDRRVDEKKVATLIGPVGKADAQFVRSRTGFVIGGVAPVGHLTPPMALLDASLQRFSRIWAAAGHPRALVALSPPLLEALTGAPWAEVTA
ncbi:YbaK/EbsC family protein [Lampropedia puyangensis]|uniref:YbaK/EbsC family protein n=1 Tax=Lampropedia puyangensis TaxID=1330072 RepID=A0A4S8F5Q4_9BURK|nr:YbaK/EbsC family protein [Lampropedia puyangensis]THU02768.1 YbaK/EbsC family protein [Lampropedia puyangensis]